MEVIKRRKTYYIVSLFFALLSLILLFWTKLNYWIDMTWWIQLEYSYENTLDIESSRNKIDEISLSLNEEVKNIINDTSVYKVSWENIINIVAWFDDKQDEKTLEEYKSEFRALALASLKDLNWSIIETSYQNIGKSFWDYIKDTAILTLVLAIVAITFYVTWAFSWVASWISVFSFSGITILTLFHDVVIATWLYILTSMFLPEFKIDTFFVTALLTILGYSINDTIVIFDRIRANLKNISKHKMTLEKTIDFSISETLKRSIYTSLTVLFVLVTIFSFWPESILGFTLVMIYGTIVWTYSSIFIASPLLYELNKNKKIESYKKKKLNPEDKIVV